MSYKKKIVTDSGIEIRPVYTNDDVTASRQPESGNNEPGQFPFTRGIQADMPALAPRKKVINVIIIYYHKE